MITCVDEFHHGKSGMKAKGHKCSTNYNFKHFKNNVTSCFNVNDSTSEQRNPFVNFIRKSAAWFNRGTFMYELRLLLEIDNRKIERKLLGWD